MTVIGKEYAAEKKAFIRKHGTKDWRVETSPMDEYDVYYKTYIFGDNAVWYERMSPEWEDIEAEAHGCKFKVSVKFFRTEYWNTDNACSKYYYEKY